MQKEADTAPDPDLEIKGGRVIQTWEFPYHLNVTATQIQYTKNLNPGRFEFKSSITIPILE